MKLKKGKKTNVYSIENEGNNEALFIFHLPKYYFLTKRFIVYWIIK